MSTFVVELTARSGSPSWLKSAVTMLVGANAGDPAAAIGVPATMVP